MTSIHRPRIGLGTHPNRDLLFDTPRSKKTPVHMQLINRDQFEVNDLAPALNQAWDSADRA